MKIFALLQSNVALLAVCLLSSIFFTSCGGGGGGDGGGAKNNDTAPATLDGLELFFVDGVASASFQFAKVAGDANAAGETGFSNSIEGGDGFTTEVEDFSGFLQVFDLFERMSNITYTYNKTGTNSGLIVIDCQTFSNESGNVDIFANDDPSGSDITFTMRIVFGSASGVIGEVAIEYIDVPVEADPPTVSYFLTTNNSTIKLQTQGGADVPVGYDEIDAGVVTKKTPDTLFPEKFSAIGTPFLAQIRVPSLEDNNTPFLTFDSIGVSSDDQGFGFEALDQGIINTGITITGALGSTTIPSEELSYGWFGESVTGSDTEAELRLILPDGTTQKLRLAFTSFEQGALTSDNLTPLINYLNNELGELAQPPTALPIPDTLPDVTGSFEFPFGD